MNLSNYSQIAWFSKPNTGLTIFKAKISHSHIRSAEKKEKKKRRVRGSKERDEWGRDREDLFYTSTGLLAFSSVCFRTIEECDWEMRERKRQSILCSKTKKEKKKSKEGFDNFFFLFFFYKLFLETWLSKRVSYFIGILSEVGDKFLLNYSQVCPYL